MKDENIFRKYYRKLKWLGILRAMLLATVYALAAVFLAAIVIMPFYLSVKTIIIVALISFGGVLLVMTPVLYWILFQPTARKMDREIDKLGLEERVVTMHELQNDESYIALCQREDAKEKLRRVKPSDFKLNFSKISLLTLTIALVLSVSMTAISALVSVKYYESLRESEVDPEHPEREPEYVTLIYTATEGMGHIEGETQQIIVKGSDAEQVTAVPEEGFIFVKWSDDYIYAERWDWNVLEDINVEAIFIPRMEGGGNEGKPGDEGGDGGNSQPGGEEGNGGQDNGGDDGGGLDDEEGQGNGDGAGEEEGGHQGNESQHEGEQGSGETQDDLMGSTGTGGRAEDNTIIDGETDYRTAIDSDYEEDLENDDSIPPELKELIERYLDSLKP